MTDYKDTLNLPKTDFPMKANLANAEPARLAKWQGLNLYQKIRDARKDKKTFVMHDGPPYANGDIHLGHALNKILKDIVVKSQTLNGFNAQFIPGWDCHGLPIELNVEKKKGKPGHKISAKEFRVACREYAKGQVEIQKRQFKRLGILADWEQPYLTMDFDYEAGVVTALAKILEKGFIKRGVKPVYWCIDCGSALAEAEVEYHDKRSFAIDVRFSVVDSIAFLAKFQGNPVASSRGLSAGSIECNLNPSDKPRDDVSSLSGVSISVPIWTTTPWTLPANEAVTLGADIDYALIQCETSIGKEQLLIAEALLNKVVTRYGIENYRVVAYCKGQDIEGLLLQHPFYDKQVPICLGLHVTTEDGTGCVHTAPAHGVDDYAVGGAYNLPIGQPVLDNGCYADNIPLFSGKFVRNVEQDIIDLLQQHNKLLSQRSIEHSYPNCWRHKTPLIFRATPQWFVEMDGKKDLRGLAIAAANTVTWYPDTGKNRMVAMLQNRPDWCISRQRAWGVPIPFIMHKQTGELHADMQRLLKEKIVPRIKGQGIEGWFELDLKDILGDAADEYQKSQHVLDVWFDSGSSHECVLKSSRWSGLHHPADVILEGADQHRGWFQSLLLTSVCLEGKAPYKDVVTHGFTVDGEGRKMSKSIGNVIAPETIIKTYGADMLRLWVASTDYQQDLTLSDDILKRTADVYLRIRNTARFLLSNLYDFDPDKDLLSIDKLIRLDRWVIFEAALHQDIVRQTYDSYDFHAVYTYLMEFCANNLGRFYLDIIKDRLYTANKTGKARRSAQTAMYHILQGLVHWMAPILSFTADEIWQHMPGSPKSESVFLNEWYSELESLYKRRNNLLIEYTGLNQGVNEESQFWAQIKNIRNAVNKAIEDKRAAGQMGSGLEANVILYADNGLESMLNELRDELRFVLITSGAVVKPLAQASVDAIVAPGFTMDQLKLTIDLLPEDIKCERCWQRREDVNKFEAYPGICGRCVDNIVHDGEVRHYA